MKSKSIAIIPARGGSKRVPRKNVRPLGGKPIMAYPIAAALESGCFEDVMVSTEDTEIAEIAKSLGASVPFYRSSETANDIAPIRDLLLEVFARLKASGREYTYACCIFPTAALITANHLRSGLEALESNQQWDSVATVQRYSMPIERSFRLQNGTLSPINRDALMTRTQDLQPAYYDAGQLYWFRVERFIQNPSILLGPSTGALILEPHEAVDVDTEEDWKWSEILFAARQHLLASVAPLSP